MSCLPAMEYIHPTSSYETTDGQRSNLLSIQSGSSDAPATPLIKPCEFNSCPTGSPATGFNASNPRLNYVNSYPVTSMRYGIQTLSPKFFGAAPELAVAGFNVGGTFLPPSSIPLIENSDH